MAGTSAHDPGDKSAAQTNNKLRGDDHETSTRCRWTKFEPLDTEQYTEWQRTNAPVFGDTVRLTKADMIKF